MNRLMGWRSIAPLSRSCLNILFKLYSLNHAPAHFIIHQPNTAILLAEPLKSANFVLVDALEQIGRDSGI